MKDECYNKKIEATKLKIARNFKEVEPEELDICVQGNTNLKVFYPHLFKSLL